MDNFVYRERMSVAKKWWGALAAALMVLVPAGATLASTLNQYRDQLSQVQSQMSSTQSQIQAANAQAKQLLINLQITSRNLAAAEAQVASLQAQTRTATAQVDAAAARVAQLQAQLAQEKARLGVVLRSLEVNGQTGYLEVLLGSRSFGGFVTRLQYLKMIMGANFALVHRVQKQQTDMQVQEAGYRSDQMRLERLSAQAQASQNQVAAAKTQQQSTLTQIEHNAAALQAAYNGMKQEEARINAQIDALMTPPAGMTAGQALSGIHFIWPVHGTITSPFGPRIDPITHQPGFHYGIDIGVPMNTPVHAAASGKVLVVAFDTPPYMGYGKLVVIDNGNGVTTWYAHNNHILVQPGEAVQQGQVIADAGMTGWATGPHVDFRIRFNGQFLNPMQYLPPGS